MSQSWDNVKVQSQYHNLCYTKYGWTEGFQAWLDHWKPYSTYHVFQEEKCPDTGRTHYQGYIEFTKKLRHGAIKKLDKDMHFGARYPKSTSAQAAAYCKKDDSRMDGPWEYGDISRPGTRTDVSRQNQVYAAALEATSVEDAMALIRAGAPRDLCLHGEAIRRNLNVAFTPKFQHKYTIDQYTIPPKEFIPNKSLHFYGDAVMGKTNFALAHFANPLLVRHMDTLKKINPDIDGLVFDEMTYYHLPHGAVKTLLDVEHTTDIHARNVCATIPAGMNRIFCSNEQNPFYKEYDILDVNKNAIESRLVHHHFIEKCYLPDENSRQ